MEAQEIEQYKSETALHSEETGVKLETGDIIHPRLGELLELLGKPLTNHVNITKTSCEIRSAVVSAATQRPQHKKCIHCKKALRNVRYVHRKLVYYMSIAEIKDRYV